MIMQAPYQLFVGLSLAILFVVSSCKKADHTQHTETPPTATIQAKPAEAEHKTRIVTYTPNTAALLADFRPWYEYHYRNIKLAQDFVGLDADSSLISKIDFLNRLATGRFIALKVVAKNDTPYYKLTTLVSPDPTIKEVVKQLATTEIKNFQMEGKPLPAYSFTDLQGNTYSNNTTTGKIVVLKCWFIGCVACVAEFPKLNKVVDSYKNDKNIVFVSLASDSKEQLTSFLSKREFQYAVVPDAEAYMTNKLHIDMYPTHILVGKDGRICKVTNTVEDIIPFIRQQTGQTSS